MNTGHQIQEGISRHITKFEMLNRPFIFDFDEDSPSSHEPNSNTILDMVDVHVSIVGRNLMVLWANEKAKDLFGSDMVGKQCHEIYTSPIWVCDEQSDCLIKRALFEDHTQEHEVKLFDDDGKEKSFFGKAQVVSRDKDGTPLSIAMIYKEITEHKLAKNELEESIIKLEKNIGDTVKAICRTIETKDPYTAGHQQKTMIIARDIATIMGLSQKQIKGVSMAGAVHDLGKICVPASILSKPGRITNSELSLIREHPETGFNILKDIDFNSPVAEVVLQHHERLDGSGYPYGLVGDAILIESKIVAVADVIEAIASPRPYRGALGVNTAIDEIQKNSGNLYDPRVVDAALELFSSNNNKSLVA
ncbi:MAG: HD domain-containing protein [Desulfocapsa sp.]|nr:HD domain-containing protein [Desulfocapsa sp.]